MHTRSPTNVTESRRDDFLRIREATAERSAASTPSALVVAGDSLEVLRRIPEATVSLVLTDPPYHATKKENIYGDTAFAEDRHYLEWMAEYAVEWRRVLKANGSLFCFCDSSMAARLEVEFAQRFNMLAHVVWTKPNDPGFDGWKGKMRKTALRQWYPHSERILFAEPAVEGNLFRSPLGHALRALRKQSGLSMHQLTAMIGAHGKVNHGGAVSNWEAGRNTPSREQYDRLREALLGTGNVDHVPYFEDMVRPFAVDASKEFTDVWSFPSVRPYRGKHPAEKPADLLEHAIEATTYPGDIVLDCFAGGGSTALAALRLGRRSVAIEIEDRWVDQIVQRVASACTSETVASDPVKRRNGDASSVTRFRAGQMPLFLTGK